MPTEEVRCRICDGPAGPSLRVREMMYGTREEFDYFLCADCGCLQISEIPENIGTYYPENYFSFSTGQKRKRWLRDLSRKHRSLYAIEKNGFFGRVLNFFKEPDPLFKVYGRVGLSRKNSILDVGGGGGGHARTLRGLGFGNILAVDPFIDADVILDGEVLAKKASIFDMNQTFDLITFHHSFEHMDQQKDVLEKAKDLLTDGGKVLIRIPTVSSEAFDVYQENWLNLDAPRHFYLHSHKSISLLAEAADLKVRDLWCDSSAFQFWGSEEYLADIPMNDSRSYSNSPENSQFTSAQITAFEDKSRKLNAELRGDCLCVVLSAQ